MHTWLYRGNALFTAASTTLAGLCILATLTDLAHPSNPQIQRPFVSVEGLQVRQSTASLRFSAAATGLNNLQSCWLERLSSRGCAPYF